MSAGFDCEHGRRMLEPCGNCRRKPCNNEWPGCDEGYTGGHYCDYIAGPDHPRKCRCYCGATTARFIVGGAA